MTRCPVSFLIPVKNEERNLPACHASCRFADDIVVVDSQSVDRTRQVALEAGCRVIDFSWDGNFPKKKNWALAHVEWKHEWVFILDADERVSPELAEELQRLFASPAPELAGYFVNRRFWFLDGWLRHCGYYPSWNLRLFRHRLGRYEKFGGQTDTHSGDNEVHEHVVLEGKAGRLQGELEHYAFPTISVWVEKHNRYSSWEARAQAPDSDAIVALGTDLGRKRRLKEFAARWPFRPTLRFWYHYFWRAGFLDGYRGYVFCRLMGIYEFLSVSKKRELQRRERGQRE